LADSLETEQGRFEYYKKKLEEEKANVPQLTEASSKVVELAMHEANRDIFPPMGFINFNKVPAGVDAEKFIGYKIDDILRGTVKYIEELEEQPPAYLQGWGIANLPVFEDSAAVKDLVAKTKTDYSKISEEIYNLEDGDEADFNNPVMKNLNSKDLHDLLDSTMLNFLKEIGVERSESGVSNDNYILEKSQMLYDFLTKANSQTQTIPSVEPSATKTEETPTSVKEAEKIEPVPTSPIIPVEIPQAPQVVVAEKIQNNVVEKSQPPIEPPKSEVIQPVQNIESTQTVSIATPETANQPVSPLAAESPMESSSTTESSVSTPLLDMLANSSGMSSEEIAKMFQDPDAAGNLQKSLDISLPGLPEGLAPETANTGSPAAIEAGAQTLNQTQTAEVASKVSETIKMAEPIQAPPITPVIQQENTPKPASAESPVSQEQKVSTEENKETTPAPETKSMEDNKDKEQDQTNAELLKVMRDVLKTLQGPLIFTDGKHNFS